MVQNVEEHRKFQVQQQPHVSVLLTGKRRSGLVKSNQLRLVHDNRLKMVTAQVIPPGIVHTQCACKQMNTVFELQHIYHVITSFRITILTTNYIYMYTVIKR